MREIKFRAWDNIAKAMLIIFDNTSQIEWFIPLVLPRYEIMQFTGLKDKNGKDIYKCDKVRGKLMPDNIPISGIITWSNYLSAWVLKNDSGETMLHHIAQKEIVGNQLENPELLEKK